MLDKALQQAVENLVNGILEYESDTFSACLFSLDRTESEIIAAKLIERLLFDATGCPGSSIDGILLDDILCEIREEKAAA